MHQLSSQQAYIAMFLFLDKYYALTQADDVGALLGSMALTESDKPADVGLWNEWLECIQLATRKESEEIARFRLK